MITKKIKDKLLTDEQMLVIQRTIEGTMKESFISNGMSEKEYKKEFGDIAKEIAVHIVKTTQMELLQTTVYHDFVNKPKKKNVKTKK